MEKEITLTPKQAEAFVKAYQTHKDVYPIEGINLSTTSCYSYYTKEEGVEVVRINFDLGLDGDVTIALDKEGRNLY